MKTLISDLAGIFLVLAFAIVLPLVSGAELEKRGYQFDIPRPAIIA